ncbi:hypothetical protein JXB41_03675 [Candidatus Woesearchaeota archaeon]|nr:hypothetical protein [Candidatus Woesearchaeota archaeon]
MATTIQVKDTTFQLLKTLKEKEKVTSYDEVISGMIKEKLQVKESMFGSMKGKLKPYNKKEDRMKDREY